MSSRLLLALFVSTFLIGGALWIRLSESSVITYELAVAERGGVKDQLLNYFLGTSSDKPETPGQGPALGQNLILEYVGLVSSGEASEEDVQRLAQRYIESIPALAKTARVSEEELKIIPTSQESLQSYAEKVSQIHKDYTNSVLGNYKDSAFDSLDSEFYDTASELEKIYADTASRLKDAEVPSRVSTLHAELISTYLANAESMRALSATETDSARAFAGLVALSANAEKETAILSELSLLLTSNGVSIR